jgi:hypothetical protein
MFALSPRLPIDSLCENMGSEYKEHIKPIVEILLLMLEQFEKSSNF